MGPRLQFYLEALQIICSKWLGAVVHPAASTLVDEKEYAHLEITHHEECYQVAFYTDNSVQCLRICGLLQPQVYVFKDLNLLAQFIDKRCDSIGYVNVGGGFKFIGQLLSFIAQEQSPFYFELLDFSSSTMLDFFDGVFYSVANPFMHVHNLSGIGFVIGCKFRILTMKNVSYNVPFFMALRFSHTTSGVINGIYYGFEASSNGDYFDMSMMNYGLALDTFASKYYADTYKKVLYFIKYYAVVQPTQGGK